ncbi:3-dehydroquinate dehydratase [Granulicella rosea]|uniref:Multifunctional fusion protein n=1 Tax=Granulicella rosea TaxID=474952 RepID=A0A239E6W7_9BACT|nr:shikimate dehydrogenase [Granulicella rosea]SNS39624.1 3-dehydroquinate dehydratase [Granulicella rosea]
MPNQTLQYLRSRIGKVCVAIVGTTPAELIEKASVAVKETPFLELRLDYLEKPAAALPKIKQFIAEHSAATIVATCRCISGGGKFQGTAQDELDMLVKAAGAGVHMVDLELGSAEALKPAGIQKLRDTGVGIIVSYHDFKATGNLDAVYARILPFDPHFIKIVPTAQKLTDNLTLLRFLERVDQPNIVGICMGEFGIISRVLGVRTGSAFTFASATVGEETAPGQIAARTLIETYRLEDIDASTKVYGVAGDPVGKSMSPMMLNSAFRRETVNAVYLALQTKKIEDLVELVREIPIHGLSVTMPHKQTIMAHLEHTDPLSAKIGACNTVLRAQDGKLYGFNTDVAGIVTPLERRLTLKGAKILVLGAGGAARAAVFGLRDKGAEVFILNRTPETAQKLARQAGAKVIKREAIAKSSFDVIINTTPVGMAGTKSPALLTAEELKTRFVFDLVYNPIETPLIRLARQNNIPVITGVEMFVLQGARQFEIWTGKPAPEEEMLRVVLHALKQQAEAAAASTPEAPVKKAKTAKAT